jgi:maltooligosyltrehalose trehalohydrolase
VFVAFLENHDQVANSPHGERLRQRSHPGAHRALSALLLLGPWTPMLFQGEEWASRRKFLFFADLGGELPALVAKGRREFLAQFPSYASRAIQDILPEPSALSSFEDCKLDWEQDLASPLGQQSLALHRDLLKIRGSDPVIRDCLTRAAAQSAAQPLRAFEAAVLADRALALRYFDAHDERDRLLVMNLACEVDLVPAPEPLLAPPPGSSWQLMWSSEDARYGGYGVPDELSDGRGWHLPAYSTLLFKASDA